MDSILSDCKTLGADIDKVTYTSDYFPQMLDLAERLINAGHLYADDTPQEKMKEVKISPHGSRINHLQQQSNLCFWPTNPTPAIET